MSGFGGLTGLVVGGPGGAGHRRRRIGQVPVRVLRDDRYVRWFKLLETLFLAGAGFAWILLVSVMTELNRDASHAALSARASACTVAAWRATW